MGVSLKTYQNYENGAVTIPKDKLKAISEVLNVSVHELFNENKEDINLFDADREKIASFIFNNWDYMMESELFNATFKAKAAEWILFKKKELEGI